MSLNPGKNAKWENLECVQKLGYICKKGNTTLNSFVIPSGKWSMGSEVPKLLELKDKYHYSLGVTVGMPPEVLWIVNGVN